jgi:hypothetical protein
MTPSQAAAAIRTSAGQCWCEFTKEDGTQRVMRFQFQRIGPINGRGSPLTNPDQVRVWDPDVRGWRTITCSRLQWLDVDGKRQEIR